jgi:hypothetical protein
VNAVVSLIEQVAPGLYILLGVGLLWSFRRWVIAGRAFRATTFELERDLARGKRSSAFMTMVLLAELVVVVFGVQQVVAPTLREANAASGQAVAALVAEDDGVFVTPTRPPPAEELPFDASGIDLDRDDSVQIRLTPEPTPTPVGTIVPNAPDPVQCLTDNATLQIPGNGMIVHEQVPVVGTAFIDNFATYKLEIRNVDEGGQFAVFDEGSAPRTEPAPLSQLNPVSYSPGTYEFRLMVYDTSAELQASCQITIYISEPIPTPTPIGEA